MTNKAKIAASAKPLFAAEAELMRRLTLTRNLISGLSRSYAAADGVPFIRAEAFKREVMG